MISRKFLVFFSLATLIACGEKTVANTDSRLKLGQGRWYLEGVPFTGTIEEALPDAIRLTHFVSGLEDGKFTMFSRAGKLMEGRTYKEGKKHGIHRGWFANGKDRFYTEFADDHYAGEHWTWHSNGKVAEYKKYTPDGKILVHKHWRESGQIYRNQVFAENFELGMPGVKLCNTVKDTVGER